MATGATDGTRFASDTRKRWRNNYFFFKDFSRGQTFQDVLFSPSHLGLKLIPGVSRAICRLSRLGQVPPHSQHQLVVEGEKEEEEAEVEVVLPGRRG